MGNGDKMFFDDLVIGTRLNIDPVKIDKDEMLSFSKRYNNIPIHTDEEYAKTTKFGQIIASGMMSFLVIWAEYVRLDFAGDQLIAGKSSKIEWFAPVFAGDELHSVAEITDLRPRNSYNGIMEVTISVYNRRDELVLTNVTESIVRINKSK